MIIQHMGAGADLTTWWLLESKMEDVAWKLIWELSWLKEHDVLLINCRIVAVDSLVKRSEVISIEVSWPHSLENVPVAIPRWHWLVEWIKTNDPLVLAQSLSHCLPVGDILVLNSKVVFVHSSEDGERLWRSVIDEETVLLAILDQREAISVVAEAVVSH
jgi:hypothetical protein